MKSTKNSLEELFFEESLIGIKIHQSEQESLDKVFELFYNLENEASSDEDKKEKQYLKQIYAKAEEKRAIHVVHQKGKSVSQDKISLNNKGASSKLALTPNSQQKVSNLKPKKEFSDDIVEFNDKSQHKKFGQKALRKMLRKYLPEHSELPKEDIRLMVWENDENLDGFLNKTEFVKMYKRCVIDLKEQEPKRLFYFVWFLMFDKDEKRFIIEEDTLEILYIRYKQKFEELLINIFGISENGILPDPTNLKWPMRKTLTYLDFVERMNALSLQKRKGISHMKKDYCDYIHEILKEKGLPIIHVPKKTSRSKKMI